MKQEVIRVGNKKRIPLIGNRGFTLVELMVTIALLVMVIFMAGSFINFSFNLEKKSDAEYDFQASMRQASRVINNEIRNSSVTFTLTEDYFNKDKKDQWDYIGVEEHKEIVQYKWNPEKVIAGTTSKGAHERIVLVASNNAISYNLTFNQVHANSKLIGFTLEGINSDGEGKKQTIESKLSALNSLAVDDGGGLDNPAVAVAYRSDALPRPTKEVSVLITMVMDNSRSMETEMESSTRLKIMQLNAMKMIGNFPDYYKVAIIPFAGAAIPPNAFKACTADNKIALNENINGMRADGGTNTGDGLRRAYHMIKDYNDSHKDDEEIKNYIILLTDGNPTYYSSTTTNKKKNRSSSGDFLHHYSNSFIAKIDGDDLLNSFVWGSGTENSTNIENSMNYISILGTDLIVGGDYDIRTFVIGFTDNEQGVTRGKEIAEETNISGLGSESYYVPKNASQLEDVLKEIGDTISKEVWHIYGPYL